MAQGVKTGGRQKGTPNKTTVAVKDALQSVFSNVGGVEAMTTWARTNETEFYKLYAKMLPQEIKADVSLGLETLLDAIDGTAPGAE